MLSIFRRIYKSISFLTFFIAVSFGVLALLIIFLFPDYEEGNSSFAITDKENIKFILSFTIGGIFTLTVFSYTMVMNVLNRSISNYSPRLIPLILHERPHQIILGTTSGTIIYSLVIALYISNSNIQIPSIAAPIAILFVVLCVLLFVYFIHNVSQSIHVNYIIRKSFNNTKKSIQNILDMKESLEFREVSEEIREDHISFKSCGYLDKIRLQKLLALSRKYNISIKLEKKLGAFFLENEPVVKISKRVGDDVKRKIKKNISIDRSEPIDVVEIGFKHLVEIAVKASSPSINDPGTALIAIDYLTQLFILYREIPKFNCVVAKDGGVLFLEMVSIKILKEYVFKEMEHYMKNDPVLKEKLILTNTILLKHAI